MADDSNREPAVGDIWAVQLSNDRWAALVWGAQGDADPALPGWVHGIGTYETEREAEANSFPWIHRGA